MTSAEEKKRLEELVLESQAGNKEAFAEVYELLADKIYRFVYFKSKQEDAEDLTETIFLKIWDKLHQYKNTSSHFSAWAFRIAHNTIIDHYRTHRPLFPLEESFTIVDKNEDIDPIATTEKALNKKNIQTAIRQLKEPYREIIILKFIQDLSNEEIAEITGRTHVSVRVIQYRGLNKLKTILSKIGYKQS